MISNSVESSTPSRPRATYESPGEQGESAFGPAVRRAIEDFSSAFSITPREHAIAQLVCQGMKNDKIAGALGLSPSTVRFHLRNIHRKTGTADKVDLVLLIWRNQDRPKRTSIDPAELVTLGAKSVSIQVINSSRSV